MSGHYGGMEKMFSITFLAFHLLLWGGILWLACSHC